MNILLLTGAAAVASVFYYYCHLHRDGFILRLYMAVHFYCIASFLGSAQVPPDPSCPVQDASVAEGGADYDSHAGGPACFLFLEGLILHNMFIPYPNDLDYVIVLGARVDGERGDKIPGPASG